MKGLSDGVLIVIHAVFIGAALLLLEPVSTFLFWISGIAMGYGLRIVFVNWRARRQDYNVQ